jgi:hypothetical protein
METNAEYITLDGFTLTIAPYSRDHIGLQSVSLSTLLTSAPQYDDQMDFYVMVYCDPDAVGT